MFSNPLPKVLIVDDEPAMRTYLMRVLEPMTAKLVEVADATQALEAIEGGDFDIVLSDMYMPSVSGLELLAMAKRLQWDVGFILITGRPNTDEIIESLRLQAADFLLKPFDGNTLTESIKRSFQRLTVEREARSGRRVPADPGRSQPCGNDHLVQRPPRFPGRYGRDGRDHATVEPAQPHRNLR